MSAHSMTRPENIFDLLRMGTIIGHNHILEVLVLWDGKTTVNVWQEGPVYWHVVKTWEMPHRPTSVEDACKMGKDRFYADLVGLAREIGRLN